MKIRLILAALLSLVCVSALSAQVHRDRDLGVTPVRWMWCWSLLTMRPERAGGYDYHLHDRPYGSNDDGTYPDPDSSYTLREFERLFSGGYGLACRIRLS